MRGFWLGVCLATLIAGGAQAGSITVPGTGGGGASCPSGQIAVGSTCTAVTGTGAPMLATSPTASGLTVSGGLSADSTNQVALTGTSVPTAGTTSAALNIFTTLQPQAAANADGAQVNVTLSGTPGNITNYEGFLANLTLGASYGGSVMPNVTVFEANLFTNSTALGPAPEFHQFQGDAIVNGGNTTGTVDNFNFQALGSASTAGAGGTLNNRSVSITVPTGGATGTTVNDGIFITGNGGGGTNFSIDDESAATAKFVGTISSVGGIFDTGGLNENANISPTAVAGHTYIYGPGGAPTMSANGEAALFNYSVGGAVLTGRGGACDVSLYNSTFGLALCVPTGGTSVTLGSPLAVASGGSGVANTGNLTWNAAQTFSFTSAQTMTFPSTSATIARTDAAQTFTGSQTLSNSLIYGGVTLANAVTGTGNMVLATSPTLTTPAIGAATGTSLTVTAQVTVGAFSSLTWTGHGFLSSPATGAVQFGNTDAASPVAQTLSVQNVAAGNTNAAGANTIIQGSLSNGSGVGGTITVKTSASTAASGTQNTALTTGFFDTTQHFIAGNTASNPPTCGTGCSSIAAGSSDERMTITTGSAVTAITVNFGKTWGETPVCVVSDNSTVALGSISAISTTAVTVTTAAALTTAPVYLLCG